MPTVRSKWGAVHQPTEETFARGVVLQATLAFAWKSGGLPALLWRPVAGSAFQRPWRLHLPSADHPGWSWSGRL